MKRFTILSVFLLCGAAVFTGGCGQGGLCGYTQGWTYPENIQSVYVEMFDSKSFRRDYEYELTNAICKQLEVQTPYKIISDRNCADSILYGYIDAIGSSVIATERETGRALEQEARIYVVYSWKNLKTGELLVDNKRVFGVSSFSEYQEQDFDYAASAAVNRAAEKVVEKMQNSW